MKAAYAILGLYAALFAYFGIKRLTPTVVDFVVTLPQNPTRQFVMLLGIVLLATALLMLLGRLFPVDEGFEPLKLGHP